MVTHRDKEVNKIHIDEEGVKGISKKVLIGPEDNSDDIIMRLFTIEPGGNTPRHTHPFPHIVKWMSGKGLIIDKDGNENEMEVGMSAYIPDDELHQFRNTSSDICTFLCIIPNPDKME